MSRRSTFRPAGALAMVWIDLLQTLRPSGARKTRIIILNTNRSVGAACL